MQVRQLKISNFRGIGALDWKPQSPLCCLIGVGDTGKSTVLDAIEAALSSRWLAFSEVDFLDGDTATPICVEVTVGELSKVLKSDERFGLYIGGWSVTGTLNDEPEDGDEPVLTVRLTVDATMEPVWELVRDSATNPRTLSNRDRALFGLVRLVGDDARHLTWGQGSVLAKLTGDADDAARNLADAYRTARSSAMLDKVTALADAAKAAQTQASALGAYVQDKYGPGLELLRGGFSTSSIALHDGGVPLRLAGLGTRRLATLAIQRSAITEGAIVLIDEIEHGLEPHRVIGAIARLKEAQATAATEKKPVGQLLMTTHSDVAIGEIEARNLYVGHRDRASKRIEFQAPSILSAFAKLMKKTPRALFARRILICEGVTEVGLLLGFRDPFCARNGGVPVEQRGVAFADGEGTQAPQLAVALATLGYPVALYRDSDRPLTPDETRDIAAAGVVVFQYDGTMDTETALFTAASDAQVQALLDYARAEKTEESVAATLKARDAELTPETTSLAFNSWEPLVTASGAALRATLAQIASKKNWFKELHSGRAIAPIAWQIVEQAPASAFSKCVRALEAWLYA
ncbi:ATP-dependent nuclease [Burkholderia thailandensis]|uniref:ATP-dependent nuclease n=1 Tax=Burkholderia thailandensis TaxID=57975 RepID=UPI0022ABC721|nr:AAA family ATPase [Burkholderia thailandensis]MCZ2903229.1 AAA family ATPase [Burkholderia thailandensis]MDD1484059.1 AAA family ATPase [Burkholderia thailandensis]MDD1489960.1 AAA family ATPase [Burkholderia thailandensis]MDD1496310.1 AAA family ATPase [Burkholderia thailandensis]